MSGWTITRAVDIRSQVCPMTWVRVKLALEQIAAGEVLEVLLLGDEPLRNIPRSARYEGHEVLEPLPEGDGHRLLIRKGMPPC